MKDYNKSSYFLNALLHAPLIIVMGFLSFQVLKTPQEARMNIYTKTDFKETPNSIMPSPC
jgi:hypothetical protein